MIIKHKEQRVGVFIDAANVYHSAKNLFGANANFKNILEDVVAGRNLVRAIAYVIATEDGTESSFFEALTKSGIETRVKDLQVFVGGAKKGDCDVDIAVDMIALAPKLDAIVLVSGDGDFSKALEYIKIQGVQVEVATFSASASSKLIDIADDFFDLSNNKTRYIIKKRTTHKKKAPTKNSKVTLTKAVKK
jgi:uncharacterized LabA/DUF88 family protein